ncbi:MAG: RICIN domain-containing protein, partial [Prevotella sp.]|nr:RICIN domain-containing protein [Prevotella sp.]
RGWWGRQDPNEKIEPIASQPLSEVIGTWPAGNIDIRIGDYMFRPHQRWTITAVPEAGGYLGGPYYKIEIEGTHRALAATANAEVTSVPEFTGDPEQLWRIEQLIDGTFRIMPKVIPGREGINTTFVLYSAADSTPTLAAYDFNSDNSKWNFRNH